MKHAYLIIAHNEPLILKALISLIDDERNDIFLFIDKKSDISLFSNITTQFSKLILCKRLNLYWGHYNIIKAEIILFETAIKHGKYEYYHLLSGTCLPIKSQDYIHSFCKLHAGNEFIGYINTDFSKEDIDRKTSYYHFFVSNFANPNLFFRITKLQGIIFKLQKILHIKRKHDIVLLKGSQWVSITHECLCYILSKKKWISKNFKYTLCADEIFIQSLVWNSEFRNRIYNVKDCYKSSLRYINFQGWHPKDLTMEDYTQIIHTESLFARKFSSRSIKLIGAICKYIK